MLLRAAVAAAASLAACAGEYQPALEIGTGAVAGMAINAESSVLTVAFGNGTLGLWDIRNAYAPVQGGSVAGSAAPTGVAMAGDTAVVTAGDTITAVAAGDAACPRVEGTFEKKEETFSAPKAFNASAVLVAGSQWQAYEVATAGAVELGKHYGLPKVGADRVYAGAVDASSPTLADMVFVAMPGSLVAFDASGTRVAAANVEGVVVGLASRNDAVLVAQPGGVTAYGVDRATGKTVPTANYTSAIGDLVAFAVAGEVLYLLAKDGFEVVVFGDDGGFAPLADGARAVPSPSPCSSLSVQYQADDSTHHVYVGREAGVALYHVDTWSKDPGGVTVGVVVGVLVATSVIGLACGWYFYMKKKAARYESV